MNFQSSFGGYAENTKQISHSNEISSKKGTSLINQATLFRITQYLNVLEELEHKTVSYISTTQLSELLGINCATVKQDLKPLQVKGRAGVGYAVADLLAGIQALLLPKRSLAFAVVGFGMIGHAIVKSKYFENGLFCLRAVFDINPHFREIAVRGISIENDDRISASCRDKKVDVGIICTPASSAQKVASRLVEGGVKGIWNFAPAGIVVPDDIIVVHEHLTRDIYSIAYHIVQTHSTDN